MTYRSWHITLMAAFSITAGAAAQPPSVLSFDPAQTNVRFTLGSVLHTVHGDFKLSRGIIRFDPQTGQASGELVVNAGTGQSGSGARDKRMHKDVLESVLYPEIVFTPDRIQGAVSPQGASHVEVHGMFRIHGAAHELTLPVDVETTPTRLTARSRFAIPYVKWGLKNPSTFLLRVEQSVNIDIEAVASLAQTSTP